MKQLSFLLPLLLLASCLSIDNSLPQTVKNRTIGRPIADIEAKLGKANTVSNTSTGTDYRWIRHEQRRVIVGRNFDGPPMTALKTFSCSVIVSTDTKGKITNLTHTPAGMNCLDLINQLPH